MEKILVKGLALLTLALAGCGGRNMSSEFQKFTEYSPCVVSVGVGTLKGQTTQDLWNDGVRAARAKYQKECSKYLKYGEPVINYLEESGEFVAISPRVARERPKR